MGLADLFGLKKRTSPEALIAEALGDYQLPSFSGSVMQTLQLLRDPGSTSSGIAQSIESNPALVVKVLRTVNSAAYGVVRRIDSVSHAVSFLGRARLEPLVVALVVRSQTPQAQVRGYDDRRFWAAAARRAAIARALAEMLHPQTQSEAFVAGLLQDMAVPLLAHARPEKYGPILEQWHGDGAKGLHTLEMEAFGWTHATVGAHLAQTWGLPETLVAAVGDHHTDDPEANLPAVRLVSYVRETEENPGIDELIEVCRDQYHLLPDGVRLRVEAALDQGRKLLTAFG